jgi:hypothetical protein
VGVGVGVLLSEAVVDGVALRETVEDDVGVAVGEGVGDGLNEIAALREGVLDGVRELGVRTHSVISTAPAVPG